MLPDLSGEDICKEIRTKSDIPIIMMTAKVDEDSIIHGLSIGADDYVTKPFSPRQLMARVAAALRRTDGKVGNRNSLKIGNISIDLESRIAKKYGETVSLTPNEFKILALLMSRPHKIFTRDEIIMGIKSDEYEGFDRTIDSHIRNLRQKIEVDSKNPKYILTVYGVGYRFGGDA